MFANPARGQLNEENEFPCPRSRLIIWSRETGSVVPSRVSLLISILRLNLVLTLWIPPDFRGGVHLLIPPTAISSVPSLSGHAMAYGQSAGTESVVPKVVPVVLTAASGFTCTGITMDQLMCASLFPHHLSVCIIPYLVVVIRAI